jgi:hypothetical protein
MIFYAKTPVEIQKTFFDFHRPNMRRVYDGIIGGVDRIAGASATIGAVSGVLTPLCRLHIHDRAHVLLIYATAPTVMIIIGALKRGRVGTLSTVLNYR